MKRVIACISGLLLTLGAWTSVAANEEDKLDLDGLKSAIEKVAREKKLPSVSYTLVDESGIQIIESIGIANLEEQRKATPNTLYRIGSTSKMFVALSILKLVEEGKLSLDDSVRSLAPEVEFSNEWEVQHPIRLVHLLEHTAGWDDSHLIEYAHKQSEPMPLFEGLQFHPHSRTSRWMPGTRMAYTNSGPPVAAYIVEKITGVKFENYVKQNFFEPLGMQGATYFLDEEFEKNGVVLYNRNRQPEAYWHILFRPTGAINASISDMANFLKLYIGRGTVDGKQIISEASLNRMERPESNPGAEVGLELGYGLNNYSSYYDRWYFREHNGAVNNGLSAFAYLPEAKSGYAVLINSGDGVAQNEIVNLLRKYITSELEPPKVEKIRELTDEQRQWRGYYQGINPRIDMNAGLLRLISIYKLNFKEDKMHIGPIFAGWTATEYPISDVLFQSDYTGAKQVALVTDPLAGRVVHFENSVLEPISAFWVFFRLAIVILWSIIVVSALVYLVVWLILKVNKHPAANVSLRLHIPPLLASASTILFFLFNVLASRDPVDTLGKPGFLSVGLMLASILFFVFSVTSVLTTAMEWRSKINRALYAYFALAALLHIIVAVYLLRFGLIGIMTWA